MRGEGLAVLQHCPEYIDAAPSKGDDGLMMPFTSLSLTSVEGLALGQRKEAKADCQKELA